MKIFPRSVSDHALSIPVRFLVSAVIFFFFLAIASTPAHALNNDALPRSTPEQEGVSSQNLLAFVNALDTSGMEFHSFMLLRHGKVVAEGWWDPYASNLKHTMYSCSKSFTSTAIGFAVSEKRLTVDDRVISFFPNDLPDTVSASLAALRVRDLLSMSVGQSPDPTNKTRSSETNWVKAFLATPIIDKPGSKFLYNSLASYMLSAIVQKVTGQKVIDYLRPRLFTPLHIEGMDWEVDPRGVNTGGWGLRVKTEDMAKFALLYLQGGVWEGKQVLPKEWVDEATTMKILQSPDMPQAKRDSSDWQQGYCYQFWRCRHNAFRGDGAFGQLMVAMPEQDAVLVVTAESMDMQAELNLVWKYLLPALQPAALPADRANLAALKKKLSSLSIPLPASAPAPNDARSVSGRTFTIASNDLGIRSMKFGFRQARCSVSIATDSAVYSFIFGEGKWISGTTKKPGPDLIHAKANFAGLPPFRIVASYRWQDAHTLELSFRYIESPHTETLVCTFNGASVSMTYGNSLDRGKNSIALIGGLKK
jgi:CubicO group peptidase (beta-lactamase class C family)